MTRTGRRIGTGRIARVRAPRRARTTPRVGPPTRRSTVARVLKRLGKVKRRRPLARLWTVDQREHLEVHAPNELWTIDFKGWWKAGNGQVCAPAEAVGLQLRRDRLHLFDAGRGARIT